MKNLFLTVLLLSSLPGYTTEPIVKGRVTVTGKIIDKSTSSPVEYANIIIYRLTDSVMIDGSVSDISGRFIIKEIPSDIYYIAVSFIGYKKKYQNLDLLNIKKETEIEPVMLEPAGTDLTEVNITATKDPVISKIDKKIIDATQELSATGGTALDILRNVPSVTIDGEGNVSIRGNPNFRLLIDGRPSLLQGSEGLQQISASSVKNIEIITNPSVKYDPDGNAGIINVILKKEKKKGTSGGINASAGLNRKYTIDGIVNYNKNGFNIYGGADLQSRCNQPYSLYYRDVMNGDSAIYIRYETFRTNYPINLMYRFGTDYSFSENDNISFSADFNNLHLTREFDTHTSNSFSFADSITYLRILDNYRLIGNLLNTNLLYSHKFPDKKAEISFSLSFSCLRNHGTETTDHYTVPASYETENLPAAMNSISVRNKRNFFQAKSDFILPLGKDFKVEGGVQADFLSRNAFSEYNIYDQGKEIWMKDTLVSYDVIFTQNIPSVYAIFSGKILIFEFQAGLRGEYYYRNLEQKNGRVSYAMEQFNIFPSLTLTKRFQSDREISFSYSRRVNRPDERSLNPYPFFTDAYTVQTGNPYLKPEFTDSYELNYITRPRWGNITIGSYYRKIHDEFFQTVVLLSDYKLWLYPDNIGTDETIGVEFTLVADIFKWWKIVPAVNLMHNVMVGGGAPGTDQRFENYFADIVLSQTFTFNETTKIQLNTGYMSPQDNIMGYFNEIWNVSLSARKDLFKKKLAVTLSVRDLFSTNHEYFVLNKPGYKIEGAFYPESPSVILGFAYKFNDYKPGKKAVQLGTDAGL